MKTLALLLMICSAAFADDSALVKAAKASGGPKKKSTTKVITNDDVKKSTGKLTELPGSKKSAATPSGTPKSAVEKQDEQRKLTAAASRKVEAAELKVARLESDLASIEQSYYESDNPVERDTTIKQRFALTKQQLDVARKVLADARDEQKKLTPSK